MRGGYDQNVLYLCMKFSNENNKNKNCFMWKHTSKNHLKTADREQFKKLTL